MTDTRIDTTDFWKWFDGKASEAKASPVGQLMTANGYEPHHNGGGTLAWVRYDDDKKVMLMICDEENGFGAALDEMYLVGLHSTDGEHHVEGAVVDLATAVEWCDEALAAVSIARKWVARLGGGFHPDTAGSRYEPQMSADEVEEYEQDIEKLFRAPCDPYGAAVIAITEART